MHHFDIIFFFSPSPSFCNMFYWSLNLVYVFTANDKTFMMWNEWTWWTLNIYRMGFLVHIINLIDWLIDWLKIVFRFNAKVMCKYNSNRKEARKNPMGLNVLFSWFSIIRKMLKVNSFAKKMVAYRKGGRANHSIKSIRLRRQLLRVIFDKNKL